MDFQLPQPASGMLAALLAGLACACVSIPAPASTDEQVAGLSRLRRATRASQGERLWLTALASDPLEERPSLATLYLHGSPGSADSWADYLVEPVQGVVAIAVDRPGFGSSDSGSLPSLAQQSAALQPYLNLAERLVVVGHSYGGPLALQIAVDYPQQVAGVVIVAGSVSPALEKRRWYNHAARWLSWILPRALLRSNQEIWPLRKQLQALQPRLKELRVPLAIVHGTKDALVPVENVDYLEDIVPNSWLVDVQRVDGVGHFVLWEAEHIPLVRRAIATVLLRAASPAGGEEPAR